MSDKNKELEKVEGQEDQKETFTPFCGVHDVFDPSATSECVTLCKEDNPDAFAACEEHHKNRPAPKKKTKTVSTRGKTVWGHLIGSQAGLIDVCLHEATEPVTLEAIADFSGGRVPRVLHHLKHLVTDVKVEVNFTEANKIFWAGAAFASEIKGETKSVTNYVLRKKAAPKKESAEKSEPKKDAEPEPKKDAEPEPKKDAEPEPKKDAEPVNEKKKPAEKKKDGKKKPAAKKKAAAKKKDGKKAA